MQNRQRGSQRRQPFPEKEKDKFRINENIQAREVRLIDEKGTVLGVFPIKEALEKASEEELDLVEISATSTPPICKIFNYNKFVYQREKKRKEAKKHQKTVQLKEIKFRPQTDVHDYNFKVKHIKEFLEHGDKVKVTVRFKGRELAFKDIGYAKIQKVAEDLKDFGKIEVPAKMEGRTLFMTVGPLRVATRDSKAAKTPSAQLGQLAEANKKPTDKRKETKDINEPDNTKEPLNSAAEPSNTSEVPPTASESLKVASPLSQEPSSPNTETAEPKSD